MTKVIVNSTPLIALSLMGRLSLLQAIFDEVIVPASAYDEVVVRGTNLSHCLSLIPCLSHHGGVDTPWTGRYHSVACPGGVPSLVDHGADGSLV